MVPTLGLTMKTPHKGAGLFQVWGSATMRYGACLAAIAASIVLGGAGAASAADVLAGVYAHDLGPASRENGEDILVGWRSDQLGWLKILGRPSAYVTAAANTDVSTDWLVTGVAWKFKVYDKIYVRPNFGIGYTTGKASRPSVTQPGLTPAQVASRLHLYETRISFGTHWQFNPGLSAGYQINDRLAAELSYEHLSNGQILHQGDNEGLDDVGVRLVYAY